MKGTYQPKNKVHKKYMDFEKNESKSGQNVLKEGVLKEERDCLHKTLKRPFHILPI